VAHFDIKRRDFLKCSMHKKLIVFTLSLFFIFSFSAFPATKKKTKSSKPSDVSTKAGKDEDIITIDSTSKKPEDAVTRLTKAIKRNPHDARAYRNRADVYLSRGKISNAISDYTRALGIDPYFADTYFSRAFAYRQLGFLNRAIADYSKAIELNPHDVRFYFNRADVYGKKGDYTHAIEDYDRAITIDPKVALFYNGRAAAYFFKKEYEKSWADVAQAQALGGQSNSKFIEMLKKASGRDK
jgi:tetratricopeptide (TPR) repeat protein